MANSYYDVNYSSPSTTLTFTNNDLKYLETAHISLVVSNTTSGTSATFLQTDSTTFTISVDSGTTTINYAAVVASFPTGANKIRVTRTTPSGSMLTLYSNSSMLRSEDLNKNSDQLLYVLQEQIDQGTGSLPLLPTGVYDAGNKRITNLADGIGTGDAASWGQVNALIGGSENAPAVAQNWEFNLGATSFGGTIQDGHSFFTLDPVPASTVNAGYIVEIAGVLQRPDYDFTVDGNVLKITGQVLNGAEFNNTTIAIMNFGLSRQVFEFPITGSAQTSSETPITLKGYSGGDTTALLKVTDSSDTENANISAGGTIKAKVIEPISGSLTVNPTTVTTSGTLTAGGNFTCGTASITQATGDATVNKLVISSTDTANFAANMAVPKSYVDASGGFGGEAVGATDSLNGYMTPGNFRGTTPMGANSYGYPSVPSGRNFTLEVKRGGGPTDNTVHQIIHIFSSDLTEKDTLFTRFHSANAQSGSSPDEWSSWRVAVNDAFRLGDLTTNTNGNNYNLGSTKITNSTAPTDQYDLANKQYVDQQVYGSVAAASTHAQMVCILDGRLRKEQSTDAMTINDASASSRSSLVHLSNYYGFPSGANSGDLSYGTNIPVTRAMFVPNNTTTDWYGVNCKPGAKIFPNNGALDGVSSDGRQLHVEVSFRHDQGIHYGLSNSSTDTINNMARQLVDLRAHVKEINSGSNFIILEFWSTFAHIDNFTTNLVNGDVNGQEYELSAGSMRTFRGLPNGGPTEDDFDFNIRIFKRI